MSPLRLVLPMFLALAPLAPLHAAPPAASQASSAASMLPLVIAVTAPSLLAEGTSELVVVSVEASAAGTQWTLERASDGARIGLTLSAEVSTTAGSVIEVSAIGAGWILSSAGEVLAIIPNELGQALLHHQRLSR